MFCKNKVGSGIRKDKAEGSEIFLETLAGRDDPAGRLLKPVDIFRRGCADTDGRQVHGVGIEGKLDVLEVADQLFAADGKAHTGTRHCAGFGEGLHHEQIVIFFQKGQGRLSAEIDVGLVHDHDAVGVARYDLLHIRLRQLKTCRRIGIGENNTAVFLSGHRRQIVFGIDGKVLPQRYLAERDPVEICPDIVEGIGDVGEKQGLLLTSGGKEGQKAERQNIVGTNADEDLIGVHLVLSREGIYKRGRIHIGIQAQSTAVPGQSADCLFHSRCRRVRAFIGVQLYDVFFLGLLARHIGFHLADFIFPGHVFFLFFMYLSLSVPSCIFSIV